VNPDNQRPAARRWPLADLLLLAVLPFVVFAPVTVTRQVFALHDVQAYFYPYHVLPAKLLAQGHLPLWNPYVFSGIPLLGDGQTAMFYPPNWLFFVLPGEAALNHVVLLQFSIAGVGMNLFARALGLSRLPALVSAFAYMFCGFLTARIVHLSIMSGAALLPLVFFCADRLLRTLPACGTIEHCTPTRPVQMKASRSTRLWLVATALVLAFQAVAGHPQIPVYTGVALALYAGMCALEQSLATGRWSALIRPPMRLAGAYLLGLGLAAIQLVPWFEAGKLSTRAAGASFEFVFGTSTTGVEWLLVLFPYLLGLPHPPPFGAAPIAIEQAVRVWEHSVYTGILPLVLAVVGLGYYGALTARAFAPAAGFPQADAEAAARLRHRWYSLSFLLLLLGIGCLIAAGWHTAFGRVLYALPVIGKLRAVERAMVLADFALAVLAGFGLQHVIERPRRPRWLLLPAVLIPGVPTLVVWYAHQPASVGGSGDFDRLSLALPHTWVSLSLALASGLLLAWWSRRRPGAVTLALAVGLVVIDMGLYASTFTPTASRRLYRYRPQVIGALPRDGEPFRKATVIVTSNDLDTRVAQETLALSWAMLYGFEDINGFNSLQPRRYTDYVFGPQEGDVSYGYLRDPKLFQPDSPVLSSLNVRYVLVPEGTDTNLGPHLRLVFENAYVRLYENTLAYPRAYFTERVRAESDPRAVLRAVTAPGFDGRRETVVESSSVPALPVASGRGSAIVTRTGPNDLRIATEAAESRFLVVSEMYFPGWNAYVDDAETPIYRTNYLFRGVVVPPGRHTVTFAYRPRSIAAGAGVSMLSVVVAAALLYRGRPSRAGRRFA
jgi:hypothetical protein